MNTIATVVNSDRSAASISERRSGGRVRGAVTVLTLAAALTGLAVGPASADATTASTQSLTPAVAQSLTLPAAPAAPVATRLSAFDSSLMSLVNAKRQALGLTPMTEVTGLDTVSGQWSQAQANNGRWANLVQDTGVAAQTVIAGATAGSSSAQSLAKWYPQTVKVADVYSILAQYPDAMAKMSNPNYKYVGIRTSVAADGTSVAALTFTDTADPSQLVDPVAADEPTGALTGATQEGAVVELSGSAADADASTAVQIRLQDTVPGSAPVTTSAAVTNGQFDTTMTLVGSGTHHICATVVNQGAGNDLALGCVDAVMSGLVGGVQAVVPGQAAADITGWAVDPDAPTSAVTVSIVAHSATGDTTLGQLPADVDVPALAASFPGVGTDHGFGAALPATPGPQNICAVATTVQTGRTVQLGCQDVVIPGSVLGNLDTLRQSGANLTATGWGMDQAAMTTVLQATVVTTGPQGTSTVTLPASLLRSDVLRAYPASGGAHGFSVTVPTEGAGVNKMCVTMVAPTPISPAKTFACRTVTVS